MNGLITVASSWELWALLFVAVVAFAAMLRIALDIVVARLLRAGPTYGGPSRRIVREKLWQRFVAASPVNVDRHFWPIRYVAWRLSKAASPACTDLVRRILAFRPLRDAEPLTSEWLRWHRVHIPPYAVMASRRRPARQRALLSSFFSGTELATRDAFGPRGFSAVG